MPSSSLNFIVQRIRESLKVYELKMTQWELNFRKIICEGSVQEWSRNWKPRKQ